MQIKNDDINTTGVIIGRFQVPELHQAHINLINSVYKRHTRVIIFLGLSPLKCTYNNPLDFKSRKQMIATAFPAADILYIKDVPCDKLWSNNLDEQIKDLVAPGQKVFLYGGRDSFVKHYAGRFKVREFKPDSYFSGTEIRKSTVNKIKNASDWRAGVIHATQTQYINAVPTVDIAILNEKGKKVLLGRKREEVKYRFIGGHVNAGETLELAASREAREETSLEIGSVKYVGSCVIDDWRHRSERTKITSALFTAQYIHGAPDPNDDIHELRWFNIDQDLKDQVVDEHQALIELLTLKLNS